MKNRFAVIVLAVVAPWLIPGSIWADMIQYDFWTNASIVYDGGASGSYDFASVDNTMLSLVVDWTNIDYSGPDVLATGVIRSITASIPYDPLNGTPITSALLNDTTGSNLPSPFTTLGFGTTLTSDAAADLADLVPTGFSYFDNAISAIDPFGVNPIFGGPFIVGSATQGDILFDPPQLGRDYFFELLGDGTAGTYAFTETVINSYLDLASVIDSESANIVYEGELLHVTPVPEPSSMAALCCLGAGLFSSRKSRRKAS